MRLERPFHSACVFRGFENALTPLHTMIASRSVQEVANYCEWSLGATVRLGTEDVLLFWPARAAVEGLCEWLAAEGFDPQTPVRVFRTDSDRPVEEGYFGCLSLCQAAVPQPLPDPPLDWRADASWSHLLPTIVGEFVEAEAERLQRPVCGHPLTELYGFAARPWHFDDEDAGVEFAASIIDSGEVRVWSRPVLYPK